MTPFSPAPEKLIWTRNSSLAPFPHWVSFRIQPCPEACRMHRCQINKRLLLFQGCWRRFMDHWWLRLGCWPLASECCSRCTWRTRGSTNSGWAKLAGFWYTASCQLIDRIRFNSNWIVSASPSTDVFDGSADLRWIYHHLYWLGRLGASFYRPRTSCFDWYHHDRFVTITTTTTSVTITFEWLDWFVLHRTCFDPALHGVSATSAEFTEPQIFQLASPLCRILSSRSGRCLHLPGRRYAIDAITHRNVLDSWLPLRHLRLDSPRPIGNLIPSNSHLNYEGTSQVFSAGYGLQ